MKQLYVLAAFAASSIGFSQTTDFTPANVNLRLGIGLAVNDSLRDRSNSWIGVGLDYNFVNKSWRNSEAFLSFDWYGRTGSGGKGNFFPLMVNWRFWGAHEKNEPTAYGFIGAGVVVLDVQTTKTVLGARAGVGFVFNERWIGEASYLFSANADGVKADTIGFHIGYRF